MPHTISDQTKQVYASIAYIILVPIYMLLFTHLINIYHVRSLQAIKATLPLLSFSIWFPALLAFGLDRLIRNIKMRTQQKTYKWRSNPFIYIFIYSLYFFALHYSILTDDFLVVSLSGFLLVFFSFLIKPIMKELEYLPLREKFHFYLIVFIFPLLVLLATDISDYIDNKYTFLFFLFPLAYIPGLSLLSLVCLLHKTLTPKKKRKPILIEHAACISLLGTLLASIYLTGYIGNRVFMICFLMTFMMFLAEQIFLYTRQKMYQKQNALNKK